MYTALLLFLFVLLGLGLITIVFSILRTILTNLRPGDSKIQADISAMRAEIAPYVKELVPLDQEELELFSLTQINQTIKRSITTTGKGVFTSVYQEPLLAYSYKKYVGQHDALLLIRTAKHEVVYRIKKKEIRVVVDKAFFGVLKADGHLFDQRKRQVIGQLDRANADLLLPVFVGKKEVATLQLNQELVHTPQPRAFQFVDRELTEQEQLALLVLSGFELVQRAVKA